jgi:hypothetical protein
MSHTVSPATTVCVVLRLVAFVAEGFDAADEWDVVPGITSSSPTRIMARLSSEFASMIAVTVVP